MSYREKVAEMVRERIQQGKFNWKRDSFMVASFCPELLDPEKFNWTHYSWAVAAFCPDKLDPKKFNWKDFSWDLLKNYTEVALKYFDYLTYSNINPWAEEERLGYRTVLYCIVKHILGEKKDEFSKPDSMLCQI